MQKHIPSYSLYGDQPLSAWNHYFNFEWIPERSGPNDWLIQPHRHSGLLHILLLQQGGGDIHIDNARWTVQAPCLILVPAQTVHGFHWLPHTDGPVVTAAQKPLESLAGMLMPELLQIIRKPAVTELPAASPHSDMLMPLFYALESESRMHDTGESAAGLSLMTALLVKISRLHRELAPAVQGQSRRAAQLERFRSLVDEQFRQRQPLDVYARELGITVGQLSRLCREALGMSSLDVINARVIHEAQRDLVYTSKSIKQVAAALGFDDEAYFGRFFRKHTGLTPSAFRTQATAELQTPDGPTALTD
ncbi:helix-turn-helix domain-containing protein [Vogesella sp. GCM10023246]|uniref:Helix-turn-helix domain-containing protein n=1 Tax=Vogesella oryzagri TaxID=3160864 RepID=A0ABV1M1G9_9NEIS